jgi:hypothetical protein
MVVRSLVLLHGSVLANISTEGGSSVQTMYQTVLEFFRTGGPTEGPRFQMPVAAADAHIGIPMTCIRYLTLCTAGTVSETGLPRDKGGAVAAADAAAFGLRAPSLLSRETLPLPAH